MSALNDRAEKLLKALVQLYIDEGQPVGSRTLARESGLDISPATVRNVMADLEEMGLIDSPHTSAGRVPTNLGYRVFVDSLLTVQPLNARALGEIQGRLREKHDPDNLLAAASDLLSQITHFAGVVLVPRQRNSSFLHLEYLPLTGGRVLAILVTDDGRVQNRVIVADRHYEPSELVEAANYFNDTYAGSSLSEVRRRLLSDMKQDSDEMHRIMRTAVEIAQDLFEQEDENGELLLSGEENLLGIPDLCEISKLQRLFDAFRTKQDLLDLLDKSMKANGVHIFIGDESGYRALDNCSVVTSTYTVSGEVLGTVGVIGPTRMAYGEVIPIVDVTARLLSTSLGAYASRDIR